MITKAKLRTKTGCLSCRKRRKKCDEVKPICTGCQRNRLECIWPGKDEFQDRRNLPKAQPRPAKRASSIAESTFTDSTFSDESSSMIDFHSMETSSSSSERICNCNHSETSSSSSRNNSVTMNFSSAPPPDTVSYDIKARSPPYSSSSSPAEIAVMNSQLTSRLTDWYSSFNSESEYATFTFMSQKILPNLVHREAHPLYHDFSYTISMAMRFRPFMDIFLGTALITLSLKEPQYKVKAMEYYQKAIHALREGIANGTFDGTEDHLLASVVALCLFERRRPDSFPRIVGNHVRAVAQLFRLRAKQKKRLVEGSTEAVFNRVCAESLMSQSALMMIYDKDFDPFEDDDDIWEVMDKFIMNSPVGRAPSLINWPVMGIPYPVIKMAVQASRLSKKSLLTEEDMQLAATLNMELESWEQYLCFKEREAAARAAAGDMNGPDSRASSAKLYVIASKVLLSMILSGYNPDEVQMLVDRGVAIVRTLDMRNLFMRTYVWPLTILGCASTCPEDLENVKEKLDIIRWEGDDGGMQRWLCRKMEEMMSVLLLRRADTDASKRLEILMSEESLEDISYRVLEL